MFFDQKKSKVLHVHNATIARRSEVQKCLYYSSRIEDYAQKIKSSKNLEEEILIRLELYVNLQTNKKKEIKQRIQGGGEAYEKNNPNEKKVSCYNLRKQHQFTCFQLSMFT